jgi:hypothetical protein
MRSGLICPVTEKPCTDGLCKIDHYLTQIRDQIAAKQAKTDSDNDAWAPDILGAAGLPTRPERKP